MRRTILLIVGVALASSLPSGQEPAFEVASVKVTTAPRGGFSISLPGEVRIESEHLEGILGLALNVPASLRSHKFVLGPAAREPVKSLRFEIHAKGSPKNDPRAMLRTLLGDRFGLRWHRENREVSIYALTVKESGKLG